MTPLGRGVETCEQAFFCCCLRYFSVQFLRLRKRRPPKFSAPSLTRTGAVIPNAKVTLLRVQTREQRVTETDGSGNYSFPLIEIGDYTVSVEKQGFKTQTSTGIHVEYQQKARVNFSLMWARLPSGSR